MQKAEDFATKSSQQKEEFESLLSDFNKGVGEFKDFAKTEKAGIQKEIDAANGELVKLQQSLATALNNAQLSLASGLGAGMVGVAFLGLLFPPALPFILVRRTPLLLRHARLASP